MTVLGNLGAKILKEEGKSTGEVEKTKYVLKK